MSTITPQQAKKSLDENKGIIIDVREPIEISACSISKSIEAPLSQGAVLESLSDENIDIIVMCQSGSRSKRACKLIEKQHPNYKVYILSGGINAWEAAGLPVNKKKTSILSLERQVQLTVGTFIFVTAMLGYFFAPVFTLFSAFLGAGLIFSGLSGTCGLAIILAKMPWNKLPEDQARG